MSKYTYRNQIKKPRFEPDSTAFKSVNVNISRSWKTYLQNLADETETSISTLIARAIDNEMSCQNPFAKDWEIPASAPEENTEESKKLYDYIKKYSGLNVEHFVLQRMDIGILTKEKVLTSYRRLLDLELIEEYSPRELKRNQPRGYKICRIKPDPRLVDTRKLYRENKSEGPLND